MAKNKIQFQKGLSLSNFLSKYGTEEKCHRALYSFRWPNGFLCPRCGHKGHCEIKARKVYQCNSCRCQTSLASRTIFADTKLPLITWCFAIYFITQSKDGISSLNLARTLGVSANTALKIKHKIQQTIKEQDDIQSLTNFFLLDDAYWGGKKQDGVRGRGATGKTPFIASVCLNKNGRPDRMRMSRVSGFLKSEIAEWSKKHLNPFCVVISDGFKSLSGVKEAKCVHENPYRQRV